MATALITGASSGIGLEFAIEFAKHNHDLILVARSEAKLKELADAVKAKYKVTVHVLVKDLGSDKQVDEVHNYTLMQNIQVDYLVNNAGLGDYGAFADEDWNKINSMIDVNIKALTRLSWLYVREMIQRKKGRIMNVASTAAFQPGPYMAVYYASKSYVLLLSEAMANELKDHGITVTALCPGATESGFADTANARDTRLFKRKIPSSAAVAAYGYKAMMKGKTVAIHGTMNYMMAQSVRFAPRKTVTAIAAKINNKD